MSRPHQQLGNVASRCSSWRLQKPQNRECQQQHQRCTSKNKRSFRSLPHILPVPHNHCWFPTALSCLNSASLYSSSMLRFGSRLGLVYISRHKTRNLLVFHVGTFVVTGDSCPNRRGLVARVVFLSLLSLTSPISNVLAC